MAVTIELDVPVNVADKVTQTPVVMLRVKSVSRSPVEHIRDDVFAAVKKRRQDVLRPASTGYCYGMRNETSNILRCTALGRGYGDRSTGSDHGPKVVELDSASADVFHRAEIWIEMTCVRAIGVEVSLPADDYIVD
jgi:hypothetical protein